MPVTPLIRPGDAAGISRLQAYPWFGAASQPNNLTMVNGARVKFVDKSRLTDWQTPALNANWAVPGFTPLAYRMDAMGFVHFRGALINNAGAANPAFAMPTGYR